MILPSLSAMMWFPLTSITSKGPGLYWVLDLDGRCLRRTWSDIFIEYGFTYDLLFFNNFYVFFLAPCLLRAYLMSLLLGEGSCGNLVRNLRPRRSSAGECPVVGCGIPMCSCSILLSSSLGLLHSAIVVCQAFLKIFMSLTAKSFTSGSSALCRGRWSMLTIWNICRRRLSINGYLLNYRPRL